jgi:hypothetical protein
MNQRPPNNEMKRTKHGPIGASPLISVFYRLNGTTSLAVPRHELEPVVGGAEAEARARWC